jgi:hypothetical protein
MISFIKKHQFSALLVMIAFSIAAEVMLYVFYGYYPSSSFFIFIFIALMVGVRYLLILFSMIVTIRSIFKHQHKLLFTILWILLTILGQIPKGHFDTLGALLSIYNANPEHVLKDARVLINEYEPMTLFGFPHRYPLNNAIPLDNLPSSIRSIHIGDVLVLEDYVLIEKHGLQGVFRGFVAFREGSDLWENEESITLQGKCSDCWKIRIIDGLYWYSANPSSLPIYSDSIK